MNLNHATVLATDIAASIEFYERLGLELIVRSPHYARFRCPTGDSTFSVELARASHVPSSTVVYFETASLDETVERLQRAGIEFDQEPRDEKWQWREARLSDPSGNAICLYWAGVNRLDPPWRLGRDVPQ